VDSDPYSLAMSKLSLLRGTFQEEDPGLILQESENVLRDFYGSLKPEDRVMQPGRRDFNKLVLLSEVVVGKRSHDSIVEDVKRINGGMLQAWIKPAIKVNGEWSGHSILAVQTGTGRYAVHFMNSKIQRIFCSDEYSLVGDCRDLCDVLDGQICDSKEWFEATRKIAVLSLASRELTYKFKPDEMCCPIFLDKDLNLNLSNIKLSYWVTKTGLELIGGKEKFTRGRKPKLMKGYFSIFKIYTKPTTSTMTFFEDIEDKEFLDRCHQINRSWLGGDELSWEDFAVIDNGKKLFMDFFWDRLKYYQDRNALTKFTVTKHTIHKGKQSLPEKPKMAPGAIDAFFDADIELDEDLLQDVNNDPSDFLDFEMDFQDDEFLEQMNQYYMTTSLREERSVRYYFTHLDNTVFAMLKASDPNVLNDVFTTGIWTKDSLRSTNHGLRGLFEFLFGAETQDILIQKKKAPRVSRA